MYGDNELIPEMMKNLDSISPTVCLAKWFHCTLHIGTGKTQSCYLPKTHKIPIDEVKKDVSALHNTQFKKEQRQKMLKGDRPSECKICWDIEDLPGEHYSDRHYRSVDSWTRPFWQIVKNNPWDKPVFPKYLELNFGNACNLKCTYCSPAASTLWHKEIQKEGPYKLSSGKYNDLKYFESENEIPLPQEDNPYLKAFMNWWPELKKELRYLRITGGEPLLSRATFDLLDEISEGDKVDIRLSVNSNLSIPDVTFNKFIKSIQNLLETEKIKEHILHVSLDTFGEQAEYIRDGLDFSRLQKNIITYLETVPKGQLAFMCTLNNLSLFEFKPFLAWVLELRKTYQKKGRNIFLDISHLQFPTHQNLRILSEDYQDLMKSHISYMRENLVENISKNWGFREAEVGKMERCLEWMKQSYPEKQLKAARKDFYLFFNEKDQRRNTNLLKTFPQIKPFYELCSAEVLGRFKSRGVEI